MSDLVEIRWHARAGQGSAVLDRGCQAHQRAADRDGGGCRRQPVGRQQHQQAGEGEGYVEGGEMAVPNGQEGYREPGRGDQRRRPAVGLPPEAEEQEHRRRPHQRPCAPRRHGTGTPRLPRARPDARPRITQRSKQYMLCTASLTTKRVDGEGTPG